MNTGIYYLYEYKNNQKLRNTGFLKLTRQERTCFLQINARCIPATAPDSLSLSSFYVKDHTVYANPLTVISCKDHTVSEKISISETQFPNQCGLTQIDGFFLTLPHGEILAAAAPNVDFDTRKISFSGIIEQADSLLPPSDLLATEADGFDHTEPPVSDLSDFQSTPVNDTVSYPSENTESGESGESTHSAQPSSVRKIQRSELSCLPRCYWHIANNSFLLHGYYNYNHLLLIEEDGHYWLGVPGIYDPRESRAAELFGFSQFTDAYNRQLTLSEDECGNYGRFGYWCRYLK